MLADLEILNLPKVGLETKELLPEHSGIYYVVDENQVLWYIGKAKNIHKRWQGKAHHRIYQLKQLKHKNFSIFYEKIDISQLDNREKQQINKYDPHLNNSPVKSKKVRPTETLLRETINKISSFAFILGVEPPRREIKDKLRSICLAQEHVLDLPIIHICLDRTIIKSLFNPQSADEYVALIKKAFSTRKAYVSKWDAFPKGYSFMCRLIVNEYIVEVNYLERWMNKQDMEVKREYISVQLANESINSLSSTSLFSIQNYDAAQPNNQVQLHRLEPYVEDIVPLFFDESINRQAIKKQLKQVSQDYQEGKRGAGSRSNNGSSKLAIDKFLIDRGIKLQKYSRRGVMLIHMPGKDRIGLCVRSFSVNLKKSRLIKIDDKKEVNFSVETTGVINNELMYCQLSSQFDIVYLLSGVERKAWLLIEKYLYDFAKPTNKLKNGEGYTKKYYVSARKYLVPAKVNIKLEYLDYNAWIPFGMSEQYPTFEAAKQEIKKRLEEADLPGLKLTFKKETIAK